MNKEDESYNFNKELFSLPVTVDSINMSGQDNEAKKKIVQKTLTIYVSKHSEDEDYGDLGFLLGLLKMLHCYPNDIPKVVEDNIPSILKSIGFTDLSSNKSAKEAIYDYIDEISNESLGEFHI